MCDENIAKNRRKWCQVTKICFLALSVSLLHTFGIHCLPIFVKHSHFLLSDVISKRTTFSQPFPPPSDPLDSFLRYQRYINHLLTYLLFVAITSGKVYLWLCKNLENSGNFFSPILCPPCHPFFIDHETSERMVCALTFISLIPVCSDYVDRIFSNSADDDDHLKCAL